MGLENKPGKPLATRANSYAKAAGASKKGPLRNHSGLIVWRSVPVILGEKARD